jgi:pilus assembly protein Flp/PilA
MKTFILFLKDENGLTAIEYALLAVLIAVATILALKGLGIKMSTLFGNVSTKLR